MPAAKQGRLVAWMAIPALLPILPAVVMKFYSQQSKQWDADKKTFAKRHSGQPE